MAFVAAFPQFPSGDWLDWDPSIELDGSFMQEWLNRQGLEGHEREVREEIWQRFRSQVWARYSVLL